MEKQNINFVTLLSFSCHFQSLQKGFFNFDTFDVAEYEYYEVRTVGGGLGTRLQVYNQ